MDYIDNNLQNTITFLIREGESEFPFQGFQGLPIRASEGVYYKGSNIPMLMAQMDSLGVRHEPAAFTGFTSWRKFGRRVRKGGKASYGILVSGVKKIPRNSKDDTANEAEGLAGYDEDFFLLPLLRNIKTFHISQTEAIDGVLPKTPDTLYQTTNLEGFEYDRFIKQIHAAAETRIEEWHEQYKKASPMSEGERSFIARFSADMCLAHRTGSFTPTQPDSTKMRYSNTVLDWLKLVLATNPRRIMRACNLAYHVLLDIMPEIREKEEMLEEMQNATNALKAQREHEAQKQPDPAPCPEQVSQGLFKLSMDW